MGEVAIFRYLSSLFQTSLARALNGGGKAALTVLAVVFATFCLTPVKLVKAGEIDLEFENQTLSAHIVNAPLKEVVEEIAEQRGIWIKGAKNLPEASYSVKFEELSVRDALERILAPTNYCFILNENGKVEGLIVIGKSKSKAPSPRRTTPTPRRVSPRSRRR